VEWVIGLDCNKLKANENGERDMTLVVRNTSVRAWIFLMFGTVIFLCLTTQALSESEDNMGTSGGTIQLPKTGQTEC
jgi:hypothetical protein